MCEPLALLTHDSSGSFSSPESAIMLNFDNLVHGDWLRLRHVKRFNRYPRVHDESVAEHSYFVCLFAMLIARDLESHGCNINYRKLMGRATIHDAEETVIGDLDGPLKKENPEIRDRLVEIGKDVVANLLFGCGADATIAGDWQYAKKYDIEGDIIRLADLLSVVQYVASEVALGNISILDTTLDLRSWCREVWKNVKLTPYFEAYLAELNKVLNRIYEE